MPRNRSYSSRTRAAVAAAAAGAATIGAAAPTAGAHAGRAFFVSPTGSNAAAGTKAHPWRTIQKAANSVPAGSTVEIRGGVYRERVVVRVSGAPGAWITFRNYDHEHVRLDGTGLGPYDG